MKMNLLGIIIFLAVLGAVSHADLDNDGVIIVKMDDPGLFGRFKRSEEAVLYNNMVTNAFLGSYEEAKHASAVFAKVLHAALQFLDKYITILNRAVAIDARAVINIVDTVLEKFIKTIVFAMKKTFVITGKLKIDFTNRIMNLVPFLKNDALKVLADVRAALSSFNDMVTKYFASVYSTPDSWRKENQRFKTLAEKEGGKTTKTFQDSFLIPPVEESIEGYEKSEQAKRDLVSLGLPANYAFPEKLDKLGEHSTDLKRASRDLPVAVYVIPSALRQPPTTLEGLVEAIGNLPASYGNLSVPEIIQKATSSYFSAASSGFPTALGNLHASLGNFRASALKYS